MLANLLDLNMPLIYLAPQDYFLPSSIHFTIYNQKQYLVLYKIMRHTGVNFQTTVQKSRHDIMVWVARRGDRQISP